MKYFAIFLLLIAPAAFSASAQQTPDPQASPPAAAASSEKKPEDDDTEFRRALSQPTITDRIAAMKKFTADFPESGLRFRALEIIVSLRAELGDQKLRLGDINGVDLFKLAVAEAPTPISDKLFAELLIQFPTNLFFRDQPAGAFEVAKLIEDKIGDNSRQLLGLASFYLGTEHALDGKRLAEKAISIDPGLPSAYQTLGLANRLNFDLEGAAKAYEKALQLDPASVVSRRSLAEMKRATGKTDEAVKLYRELFDADPADGGARTGLILSLFDAEKRAEAETEMTSFLQANPENLFLLVGAAYWYAGHNESARAIELAEKAIAIEPRYTWAHIALARGLLQQGRPLEAERTLITARQYGNFPTLNYEIAASHFAAGFFREAADELARTFSINNGLIETKLGGRIPQSAPTFLELLSFERRASIFEPLAADNPQAAEKLRGLLRFSKNISAAQPDEFELTKAIDEFIKGTDNMRVHRQLFAANILLENQRGTARALELTRDAIGEVDRALDVASPSSAVMADDLYEARRFAAAQNQYVIVPDVPTRTLARILRGRIEELTARALILQEKPDEAVVRLNRAISVLPENSVWWRSSNWRLGSILESQGKADEALAAYLASYDPEAPNQFRREAIESLYQKIHGDTAGLDELIGPSSELTATTADPAELGSIIPVVVAETGAVPEKSEPEATEPTNSGIKIPENVPFLNPAETPDKQPAEEIMPVLIPATAVAEKRLENETVTIANDSKPDAVSVNTEKQSSLFEPIIIRVPTENQSKNAPLEKADPETAVPVQIGDVPPSADNPETGGNNATSRPRVFSGAASEIGQPDVNPCPILVNQNNISLLNDGGRLGMFVETGAAAGVNPRNLLIKTDSPENIEAYFQTDIAVLSERAFLVIRSISTRTGVYKVTLEAACGTKEITVTVQ